MLNPAGRRMVQDARAAHARQFAWSRMPSERELRRRAEIPAGTKEPSALTAMLGTFAPDFWDEGGSQTVDIYMSAGPRGANYGDADFRTCGHLNIATCSLYRVRYNLLTRTVVEWEVVSPAASGGFSCMENGVPGYYGTSEPAVSPEGRLVATRRCHRADASAISASIQVWDNDGTPGPAVFHGRGTEVPQYGNWLSEDWVIFNKSSGDEKSVWLVGPWPDFDHGPAAELGPDAGVEVSYQDPNVSHNAADAASREARIVTFGGAGGELIPRVVGMFGERERAFDLPQTIDGADFTQCHHPAWRPDGQQILCTRIQSAEVTDDGYKMSRLFGFTYDGASLWTDPTALVEFLSPEDFNSMFPAPAAAPNGLFPPKNEGAPAGTCAGYVWKYAEWCGSERFLIATVFCTDAAGPDVPDFQAIASRVVLIDLYADTATTAAYTDLTGIIEALEGLEADVEPGSFDGVFATCGAVPAIEEV